MSDVVSLELCKKGNDRLPPAVAAPIICALGILGWVIVIKVIRLVV